jgi:anti-sigma regulatory factor (Ser/Thr protein kinase)
MSAELEFTLVNRASDIPRAQDELEQFAAAHNFPARKLHEAQVAFEEHLTNVVNYGYDDPVEHAIRILFQIRPGELRIQVEDTGRPFNPLEPPPPDLSAPLDQRPIGGLGLHMMRKSLDALEYRRENDRNIVVMIKRREA